MTLVDLAAVISGQRKAVLPVCRSCNGTYASTLLLPDRLLLITLRHLDPFLPELEERLHNLTRAGYDATHLVRSGGRRRTPARRPPRRSPLVAHPRSATGNAEPGACNPRGSPSDPAHDHDLTRQAATAALGDASRVRSEPLETSTHHKAAEVFRRACCRTVLLIKDGLFEVVPGIYQVRGYDVSVRDGSIKRCEQLRGMPLTCANPGVPLGGTPGGGTKAVMPPPHH